MQILRRTMICMMGLASQYAVMCVWSAVYVRPQDPPSLNPHSHTPQCFMIGDGPYFKYYDTNPKSSTAVPKSDPTPVINPTSTPVESSTKKPKPDTITPTVHQPSNSPDETKFTTEIPTQSPTIVDETVHKNQEDGQNNTGCPTCASDCMGIHTVFLLAVCGVLMLILVTLSFCLYKQCKKQPVENLHLTRLISIPNPAFINP
ncbi:uncharacterized protein LOC120464127 isoform X2 [Pimephales promelas]|uniref:uncharacterized protein LOC120464127 isoform X2 n=1 Tax=Pimephales promelas TaxID=90988 RepID=UPI0019555CBE|nr:uncharacterized protein LOC120464127 isoform X2 [Pimephales promelas]